MSQRALPPAKIAQRRVHTVSTERTCRALMSPTHVTDQSDQNWETLWTYALGLLARVQPNPNPTF
jgi:hypothetical protein